jgi:hypothetical protein
MLRRTVSVILATAAVTGMVLARALPGAAPRWAAAIAIAATPEQNLGIPIQTRIVSPIIPGSLPATCIIEIG